MTIHPNAKSIHSDAKSMKNAQLERLAHAEHRLNLQSASRRRKIILTALLAMVFIALLTLLLLHRQRAL